MGVIPTQYLTLETFFPNQDSSTIGQLCPSIVLFLHITPCEELTFPKTLD